jgi:hypothetical protein
MRGSVRKRGNTYTWYLFTPDPVTGRRRQHSKGGYRTKKECQAALSDALASLRVGTFVESSKRTVASYLVDEWLPAMQPPRVRPSTWLSYQRNLERHVIPTLGTIELQRLTPAHLTGFYRSLLTGGRLDGRGGLSAKSVRISTELCIRRSRTRCAGDTSHATSPTQRTHPRSSRPRCRSGAPHSSAPS